MQIPVIVIHKTIVVVLRRRIANECMNQLETFLVANGNWGIAENIKCVFRNFNIA